MLKVDFKQLRNEALRDIAFLNEIFVGKHKITDLVFLKNEHQGEDENTAKAILDISCVDDKGNYFLVEIQRTDQRFFKDRCLYYSSRFISDIAPKGAVDLWKYELPPVYLIALMERFSFEDNLPGQYIRRVSLVDNETGKEFYHKLGFIYIQLGAFDKAEDDLKTDLEQWLFVIKHLSKFVDIPRFVRKPIFKKLFEIAKVAALTKEERMAYETSLKDKWDRQNQLDFAVETAVEKAVEKTIEEERAKAAMEIKEALSKAEQERQRAEQAEAAAKEQILATARNFKNMNISLADIAKATGLSVEDIERL
ncbi:Rpn family recombination-promoting nuclease/putative transposase [Desertivirga xinjiangensis]|uniref:Rpn family recombination-promoting nuclease/putative transposase n=1 Tax=Desertivirga xinjiangensis TaxID=539206 RepID=UPI00210E06E0|nr:Rpn family recombination-promoting nuclease/putative transposase [Pedobacter xinjiangensis]